MDNSLAPFLIWIPILILMLITIWTTNNKKKKHGNDPICGCSHHHAYHDATTGHCHRQHKRGSRWNSEGYVVGYEYVPCECRQYSGPPPQITSETLALWTVPNRQALENKPDRNKQ